MAYSKQNKLHIVAVTATIRREDGRLLLLKRRDDEAVYPGYYTFPGGKVEGNDTISETLVREVKEECGLDLNPGFILIKEKAIGRPNGQTSKSLSFLCTSENTKEISLNKNDFTDFTWASLEELRLLSHVGIEAEFIKVEEIFKSHINPALFFTDTDQVDFREN
ncbi:NUDIX hydrolase [Patescibacteria group bacterium]|nr:NUDIX hydrolase [Patescibacteria group bacterium]